MKKRMILIISLAALALACLIAAAAVFAQYEKPRYVVEQREGAFELRNYMPQVLAVVQVDGERKDAESRGFRLLAGYIFGGNQAADKIAMTTPVTVGLERIAMTAPVTLQSKEAGLWTVTFKMPEGRSIASLPKPKDSRVQFVEQPARRYLAVRFSGYMTDRKVKERREALEAWAAAKHLMLEGQPVLAYYDPPWNPPFVRRNEILWLVRD